MNDGVIFDLHNKLDRLLRSCSYCGRSSGFTDLLCKFCWQKLFCKISEKQIHVTIPISVTSLFIWAKQGDPLIEHVVRTLKAAHYIDAYHQIARELCYRRGELKNICFVPIPPSVEGTKDHAFFLAWALSRYTGMPMHTLLRWKFKGASQKQKTREERMSVKMGLMGSIPKDVKIILVDDIVTTGATANAAYEVLKVYAQIELWTYACRPKEFLL